MFTVDGVICMMNLYGDGFSSEETSTRFQADQTRLKKYAKVTTAKDAIFEDAVASLRIEREEGIYFSELQSRKCGELWTHFTGAF
jgi:hypothetical protein